MIKNLIKLDFYTIKPLAKFMIFFMIIPVILGIVADLGTSMIVTLTFVVFMLNIVFSISEGSNFGKLYGILPIKKSANILSRYLFSLIIVALTAIVSFIIFIVLSVISKGSIDWVYGIEFLLILTFIALFFISIQYPFYFKFEYSKASIMAILPYIACFVIGIPLVNYLMKNNVFYTRVMTTINYFHSNTVIFIFTNLGISALLVSGSYLLSRKIQKKEF